MYNIHLFNKYWSAKVIGTEDTAIEGETPKSQFLYSHEVYKLVEIYIVYYLYYGGIICPVFR